MTNQQKRASSHGPSQEPETFRARALKWLPVIVAIVAAAIAFYQANLATRQADMTRALQLRAAVSEARGDGEAAMLLGFRVLSTVERRETMDSDHMFTVGQEFEDGAITAFKSIAAAEYLTAGHPFNGSLEAMRQRLEVARAATASIFNDVEPNKIIRDIKIREVRALWGSFAAAANDVVIVSYCDLLAPDEHPVDGECPRTPTVTPTPMPNPSS